MIIYIHMRSVIAPRLGLGVFEQTWDQTGMWELSRVLNAGRCSRICSILFSRPAWGVGAPPASSPPCCLRSPHLLLRPSLGFRPLSSSLCSCCIHPRCMLLLVIHDVWRISCCHHSSVQAECGRPPSLGLSCRDYSLSRWGAAS